MNHNDSLSPAIEKGTGVQRASRVLPVRFSIIVPCFNEEAALPEAICSLREQLRGCDGPYELIVVDDGSTDGTADKLRELAARDAGLRVITHDVNRGYGAALKTGIRHATAEWIAITDADGTYPNHELPRLLRYAGDYDMVVGSRNGLNVQYPLIRKIPKWFLIRFAEWMARRKIPDLNSGMRVFRKQVAERFLKILPDGFSFTTTITMAMLTNGYRVRYEPIDYLTRVGRSKIKPIRDTLNFVQLILRTGMYFGPLRVLLPVIAVLLMLLGASASLDIFVRNNLTDTTTILVMMVLNTALFALLADMLDKRSSV